jgi:hypothetical protein
MKYETISRNSIPDCFIHILELHANTRPCTHRNIHFTSATNGDAHASHTHAYTYT